MYFYFKEGRLLKPIIKLSPDRKLTESCLLELLNENFPSNNGVPTY